MTGIQEKESPSWTVQQVTYVTHKLVLSDNKNKEHNL